MPIFYFMPFTMKSLSWLRAADSERQEGRFSTISLNSAGELVKSIALS
jgi:hypothetical protein